jgi:hypothetical protein
MGEEVGPPSAAAPSMHSLPLGLGFGAVDPPWAADPSPTQGFGSPPHGLPNGGPFRGFSYFFIFLMFHSSN